MKELLISNIKKSIKTIVEDDPKVPPDLIEVVDEAPGIEKLTSIVEELMKFAAQPHPWFYRDTLKCLQSPQQSFFGFYALRNIIRGILISLRFIQAGDLLHKNSFLASSVFSYYTASFHMLQSYLAANGRVIIDPVSGGPVRILHRKSSSDTSYSSLEPDPEVIVAILTRENKWVFEQRTRSHAKRWKELEHVFVELDYLIPEYFHAFFRYILSYGYISSSTEDKDFIQKGLKRLSEVRHESIYSGYGFDDYVHDGLTNRDLNSSHGIDLKTKAYRDLAIGFLSEAVNDVIEIKNKIYPEHWNEVKTLMAGSTFMPPFELVDLNIEVHKKLKEGIEIIFMWLMDRNTMHQERQNEYDKK